MHEPVFVPAPAAPTPLVFTGDRGAFWTLVFKGAFLELVTVGFYRFWLATSIRRHLWSHTSIDGDPLEYTGRAKELLIGFLIALAIVVPLYVVYFIIGIEAERLQAFAGIPLTALLYVFFQFALYRARRYRVTRTIWRGLRFSMRGSALSYCWRATFWALLTVVTLGLAFPWRAAALERFKMRHTSYGSLQGAFVGRPAQLLKQVWWAWPLAPFAVLLIVPAPFLYAAVKAIEWKWWVAGVRFGDVSFESTLPRKALFAIYWKVLGWFALVLTIISTIYGGAIAAVFASAPEDADGTYFMSLFQHPAFFGGVALIYLLAGVMLGAVFRLYLTRDIWAKIAATSTVLNLAAADDIAGQGEIANSVGEGLMDGLDIGGF